jgi:hypothetical protein
MTPLGRLEDQRTRTRLVLAASIVGGLLTAVFYLLLRPSPNITFGVFYAGAENAMAGRVVYETEYGLYVYTPVVLLFFYPFAYLFDFPTAVLAFRVFNVVWVAGYAAVVAGFVGRVADVERVDRLLVFGFVAGTVYPVTVVATANMGIVFGSLLGVGFVLLERDRPSGGAVWALASLVKGFPALWGLYMLRVRRFRAVGAAIVTGVGATLLGIALYGVDAYLRFFTVAAADRVRIQRFAGGNSPDNEAVTPIRPLSQLFPNVDPTVWTPVIVVVVVALTAAAYYLLSTDDLADRATLLLATVVAVTLALPTSQDLDVYLVYAPLVVLLFRERDRTVHAIYAVGTLCLAYNVGRGEIRSVTAAIDRGLSETVMVVAEPVLAFASMPLYGLVLLYAGCLLKAWRRGRERGRLARLQQQLGLAEPSTD